MPLISGIAALVVFANGTEQGGGDPQIDKQFAIVKQGTPVEPAVASTTVASSADNLGHAKSSDVRAICQDGFALTQSNSSTGQNSTISGFFNVAEFPVTLNMTGQKSENSGQRIDHTVSGPVVRYFADNGLSRLKGMDRLVSIQFNNASATDVIKWLSKQSVNFVANLDKLPKSKITMNVNQVPLHEALETVAESLGGSWQVKGSTLIFQSGSSHLGSFLAPTRAGSTNGFEFKTFGDAKAFSPMDEKQMKAFEKSSKELSERMKSYSLNLKEFPKMDPKAFEELKSLRGLTNDGKAFEFKTLDPRAFEELKALRGLGKDGKALDMKGLSGLRGSLGEIKGFKGMTFKKVDPEKFSKSMTSAQKDLMKKQGHLKFSDLTEAQRAMLFEGSPKEFPKDFTFMLSVNGEKIVIKG
jgi:hypothetical protein